MICTAVQNAISFRQVSPLQYGIDNAFRPARSNRLMLPHGFGTESSIERTRLHALSLLVTAGERVYNVSVAVACEARARSSLRAAIPLGAHGVIALPLSHRSPLKCAEASAPYSTGAARRVFLSPLHRFVRITR
jgi:hypothetical protein